MARRRSHGDGNIKKLPSGNWRCQIMDGYRDDGKRNIISFTARTKGEVQDKIRDYWVQKELVGDSFTKKTPFDFWADTWFADYESEVEASTYANYRYTLRVLKEHFGNKPVSEIKALDINRFQDSLKKKAFSKSYITKCRAMLIQIFDYAEANQLIVFNPARKAKRMRDKGEAKLQERTKTKKDAFTDTEQEFIKKGVKTDMMGHSIRTLLGSGIRVQELLALMPSDIAEDGSTISISKAIKMVDGVPTMGPPKSDRANRVVPVPMEYREDAIYLRDHSGKPYIWTSKRENGLFDVGAFRKRYYRAIKQIAGVRPLSPHCCRHTYISNLEKRGVPMEQIARLAGHSNITTTDGYLHTDIATLSAAVSVLNTGDNNTTILS